MKKLFWFVPFIFLIVFFSAAKQEKEKLAVSHIVTGDIVNLSNGKTARLLCIDAPDITHRGKQPEPFANKAIAYMRKEFEDKQITLGFDSQQDDGIGRLLAYIYREGDGLFLNAELLKMGFAKVDTRFPCQYLKEFQAFEDEAKNKKLGIWGAEESNDKNQTQ